MNKQLAMIFGVFFVSSTFCFAEDANRQSIQAALDAQCEAAREQRLAPERAMYIDECVATKFKDSREACERFYRDYGDRTADRAPLYYDLPECVKAFDFRQSVQP